MLLFNVDRRWISIVLNFAFLLILRQNVNETNRENRESNMDTDENILKEIFSFVVDLRI